MNSDQVSCDFSMPSGQLKADNYDGVSVSADSNDDDHSSSESSSSSSHLNSSSSNTTTTTTAATNNKTTKHTADKTADDIRRLAARETRTIRYWRFVVLALIVVVGAGVGYGAWEFLNAQEDYQYQEGYTAFSAAVRDSSSFYVRNLHQATRNLAETITAYAELNNETFPLVTIDIFETIGRHAREQSGIESLVYSPIVRDTMRDAWETYSVAQQGWIEESIEQFQPSAELVSSEPVQYADMDPIAPFIYAWTTGNTRSRADDSISYAPYWHVSPFPSTTFFINANQMETRFFDRSVFSAVSISREGVFTQVVDIRALAKDELFGTNTHVAYHEQFLDNELNVTSALSTPHAYLVEPVFSVVGDPSALVVGYLQGLVPFDRLLENVLPEGVAGVYVVLQNNCAEQYTYTLDGNKATFLGVGDLHDPEFDDTAKYIPLYDYINPDITSKVSGHCEYTFITYSSSEYAKSAKSNLPATVVVSVAVIFAFVALTFILYDCFVQRRNSIVLDAATKSHAILSSLFPSNVRDRLYADRTQADSSNAKGSPSALKSLLVSDQIGGATGEVDADMGYKGKPIADLFTESTVLFADIAGFTAWSSQREPAQVFTLLETLYRAFDELAKRRRVFKVETIGDCYVAVTGVPEPQKEHFVIMCRFARDMMAATRQMTKKLETRLGPDTGELDMRVGIHSGPVTAGVLRGERSRFQLFGDTMNTASRTESTGLKGRIQVSQETADLLIAAGKGNWLTQREDKVIAKGKGEMTTFWLTIKKDNNAASSAGSELRQFELEESAYQVAAAVPNAKEDSRARDLASERTTRLVEWNCDVLLRLLKQIIARRQNTMINPRKSQAVDESKYIQSGKLVIDEVQEIVRLPGYDHGGAEDADSESIIIPPAIVDQLYDYVSNIAAMYRPNFFHSFEHGSHVTMSVTKLLSRIVAPSEMDFGDESDPTLRFNSYGITNHPLIQFSCIFSALIHDVDHTGSPNAQLVKEQTQIATYYKNKSVAEQNSVDIAWHLLMDDSYIELRRVIYASNAELRLFRELVVNSVMATDIVDKDLKVLRNARWEKAFSEAASEEDLKVAIDRKATIVIEHLIQASDVSHTMQHWHVYRKWNERFFFECYKAYVDGRAETDPTDSWYKGELGFFDFYIIPLAKKLKDCGVFGVSSDEYLNYAIRNRKEWEERGEEVVQEMIVRARKEIGVKQTASSSSH